MNDFLSRLPSRATLFIVFAVNIIFALHPVQAIATDWQIPLAGNAFRTAPAAGNQGFSRNGTLAWSETDEVFTVYFHIDRPAKLHLALDARVPAGNSTLAIECGGETYQQQLAGAEFANHPLGTVKVANKGYVAVAIRGLNREGDQFAALRNLVIQSETAELALDYVKTNEGNMFYWGRRGPSVHLRYEVPRGVDLQYAYSEITVPVGQDPIGSYFMANGFSQGYFGIQVNGPEERRVLFSVWSPFQTDNPADIPADQRIVLLAKGPQVRTGQFGNEGSGGQSYLIYPWKAGNTYQFLTEVRPAGQNNTIYTSWFADKSDQTWQLIASFQRPKTDTHLTGFHSFLENFAPTTGHIGRRASYGNVWVCDTAGNWHESLQAKFSVDATGGGRHRLDFNGGNDNESFFLRNCGFFDTTGKPGAEFRRNSTAGQQPNIMFDSLPRS